jgi:hypothetical protein
MCDYSLMGVPNRLAREGENLVVHEFRTGSRGLTPDDGVATSADWEAPCQSLRTFLRKLVEKVGPEKFVICIPPGARLLLKDIPQDVRNAYGVDATEEVTFTQVTAKPYAYRDAVRFKNGRELLLQRLNKGQRVTVLQLCLTEDSLPVLPAAEPFAFRTMRVDFIAPRSFRQPDRVTDRASSRS